VFIEQEQVVRKVDLARSLGRKGEVSPGAIVNEAGVAMECSGARSTPSLAMGVHSTEKEYVTRSLEVNDQDQFPFLH